MFDAISKFDVLCLYQRRKKQDGSRGWFKFFVCFIEGKLVQID